MIPALRPSQTPRNVDTSNHCQNHRNYGHTIEGCQELQDKVEELIQVGHFHQFIKTDVSTHCRSPQGEQLIPKEHCNQPERGDLCRRDDNQRPVTHRRSESPVRRTRPQSESPERSNQTKRRVREVINTIVGLVSLRNPKEKVNYIVGGFARGGCSNSTRKKHLRAIQSIHSTSTQKRP